MTGRSEAATTTPSNTTGRSEAATTTPSNTTGLTSSQVVATVASPGHSRDSKRVEGSRANINNILNTLGYLISLVTCYLGGVAGWFGGMPNSEISSRYQTLITPSAAYFGYIWAPIFISQGIFAVAQLLPKYRTHPLVQKGIGSIYFLACSAQTAWCIAFGYQMMEMAFIAMCALLITLLFILKKQWDVVLEGEEKMGLSISLGETPEREIEEEDMVGTFPRASYWILKFPFSVHAGWIAAATPLMFSVLLVYQNVDPTYEEWAAVISVPLLFGGCMGLLIREQPGAPAYVFPGTVGLCLLGICWELQAPTYSILARHDEATINLMRNLSGFCGACLFVVMVTRFFALFLRDRCLKWNEKVESVEIDGEEYPYMQA